MFPLLLFGLRKFLIKFTSFWYHSFISLVLSLHFYSWGEKGVSRWFFVLQVTLSSTYLMISGAPPLFPRGFQAIGEVVWGWPRALFLVLVSFSLFYIRAKHHTNMIWPLHDMEPRSIRYRCLGAMSRSHFYSRCVIQE